MPGVRHPNARAVLLRGGLVRVTIYRGARAPEPIACEDFATWDELADMLENEVQQEPECAPGLPCKEQKLHMLAFGPHRLSPTDRRTDAELDGRPRHAGPYRHLANVLEVTLLVIDVDRCNAEDVAARLAALDVPALMYASPSDPGPSEPDARRVRVVAPVTAPIRPEDCERTRFAFAELLGLEPGCGVEGAIDAAKLFFVGRYHGSDERQVWRFEG